MRLHRNRAFAITGVLALAAAFAACGDSSPDLTSPVLKKDPGTVTPLLTTSTRWDFADILLSGAAGPVDYGTDETISLAGFGSIVATSSTGTHVTAKGSDLPANDPERGLGLCIPALTGDAATCQFPDDGDEVGDGGYGALFLDFSGVLPAGSTLTSIELGSLQEDEGYKYSVSTDGGSTFDTPVEEFPNNSDDLAEIIFDPGLPTADLVIKLEKASDVGSLPDNDYTVRAVTTEFTTTELEGRMTGGGVKATGDEGEVVTFGLTLHCDITLSNNLEVNWQGHQWHLDKPIESAICTDEPNIAPPPPVAPIDTFEGTAWGRLDGEWGSFAEFRFQDAGEPGSDDTVEITIYEVGDPATAPVALHITAQKISVGNWQMHYDQPHGQKP